MINWPIPKSVKQLRGFLRLIGFCDGFIHSYASNAFDLTKHLKKYAFNWIDKSQLAFTNLKLTMTIASALALLDF